MISPWLQGSKHERLQIPNICEHILIIWATSYLLSSVFVFFYFFKFDPESFSTSYFHLECKASTIFITRALIQSINTDYKLFIYLTWYHSDMDPLVHYSHSQWRIRFLIFGDFGTDQFVMFLVLPPQIEDLVFSYLTSFWMYFTSNSIIFTAVQIQLLHVTVTVFQQLTVCRHAWSILAESAPSGLAKILLNKLPNVLE